MWQASFQVQVLVAPAERLCLLRARAREDVVKKAQLWDWELPSFGQPPFPRPSLATYENGFSCLAGKLVAWSDGYCMPSCLFPSPVASLRTHSPSTQIFFSLPGNAGSCNNRDAQISCRAALPLLGSLTLRKGPLSSDHPTPTPNLLQSSVAILALWDMRSPGLGVRRSGILSHLCSVLAVCPWSSRPPLTNRDDELEDDEKHK